MQGQNNEAFYIYFKCYIYKIVKIMTGHYEYLNPSIKLNIQILHRYWALYPGTSLYKFLWLIHGYELIHFLK